MYRTLYPTSGFGTFCRLWNWEDQYCQHVTGINSILYCNGSGVDADPDGYTSALSDGDDNNPATGPDDEDGVTMSPLIAPGQAIPITVVASDTGVLNAWFDFNINGNWADAGEHVFAAVRL